MSQVQEAEKAPSKERPSQVNDTTGRPTTKEELAFAAICSALTNSCRVVDRELRRAPVLNYGQFKDTVDNCMDALREAGLLEEPKAISYGPLALEALRKGLAEGRIDHDLWEFIAQRQLDNLKAAGIMASAGVAPAQTPSGVRQLVSSIDPGVNVDVVFHVSDIAENNGNYRWRRSRARAEDIVARLVSALAGEHVKVKEDHGETSAWFEVSLDSAGGDTTYNVYYDFKEFPR